MRQIVDFRTAVDNGEDVAASIQPVADGEAARQLVFNRPPENIRVRTETLRETLREHLMLHDVNQGGLTLWGGGTITFAGSATSYTGKFTIGADLIASTFATAGSAGATPPIVSTKAALRVGTPSNNELVFTSRKKQYEQFGGISLAIADANNISVEIVDAPVSAIEVTVTNDNNILVKKITGVSTCTQIINEVTASVTANALVEATLGSGSTGTNVAPTWTEADWAGDYTKRFLAGGAAGVMHVITNAVLTTFFGTAANVLYEGDTLAIWYDAIVDKTLMGGRMQSTIENANFTLTASSLFNTRREPEKIPNSVPICKCIDADTLLFVDGTRVKRGLPTPLGISSLIAQGSVDSSAWDLIDSYTGGHGHATATTIMESLDNIDEWLNDTHAEVIAARDTDVLNPPATTFASLDARLNRHAGHGRTTVSVGPTGSDCMYTGATGLATALVDLAATGGTVLIRGGETFQLGTALTITGTIRLIGVDGTAEVNNAVGVGGGYALTLEGDGSEVSGISFLEDGTLGSGEVLDIVGNNAVLSHLTVAGEITVSGDFCEVQDVTGSACVTLAGTFGHLRQAIITSTTSALVVTGASCIADQVTLTTSATGQVVVNVDAPASFTLSNFAISVPDESQAIINDPAAPGTVLRLQHGTVSCAPFTAATPVVSLNCTCHVDDLRFTVSGIGDIVTSLLSVTGDYFHATSLYFDMANNRLNYGTTPPISVQSHDGLIDGLRIVNAGKIPSVGVDTFSLSFRYPYITIAGTGGSSSDTGTVTLRHVLVEDLQPTGSASGVAEFTLVGGTMTATYIPSVTTGRQVIEDLQFNLVSWEYMDSHDTVVQVFGGIQPNSQLIGAHINLDTTGRLTQLGVISGVPNVLIKGWTLTSTAVDGLYQLIVVQLPASGGAYVRGVKLCDNVFNYHDLEGDGISLVNSLAAPVPTDYEVAICQIAGNMFNNTGTHDYTSAVINIGANVSYCAVIGNVLRLGHHDNDDILNSGTSCTVEHNVIVPGI